MVWHQRSGRRGGQSVMVWVASEKWEERGRVLDCNCRLTCMRPSDFDHCSHHLTYCSFIQDGFLSYQEVKAELDIFINSPATDYGFTVHEEL